LRAWYYLLTEETTLVYLVLILLSWWAILSDAYLLFSCHLALIFRHATDVKKVVLAVVRPFRALSVTLALFCIIVYWFAAFAYAWPTEIVYPDKTCSTLMQCFFVTWDQGFKNDGGIGGFLDGAVPLYSMDVQGWKFWPRFVYDHLFNISLMVLLLNIVFGLVIDTFSEMRAEAEAIRADMESKCTICDLPAARFETSGNGFLAHRNFDHNMWDYYFLFAFLHRKNDLEFTGIESYLNGKLDDIHEAKSIFPIHAALVFSGMQIDDEDEEHGQERRQEAKHDELVKQVSQLTDTVQRLSEMLALHMKATGESEAAPLQYELGEDSDIEDVPFRSQTQPSPNTTRTDS